MNNSITYFRYLLISIFLFFIVSCSNRDKKEVDADIITEPMQIDSKVSDNIKAALTELKNNSKKIDDSMQIQLPGIVNQFYTRYEYKPVWSRTQTWLPAAESLFQFIYNAENEGLFPDDYHYKRLKFLKDTLDADSLTRMNARYWTNADLLLTDGFMNIIKDLKQGRLQPDSLSLNKDSVLVDKFFVASLSELVKNKDFDGLIRSIQPKHTSYWELKKGIKDFVNSMDRRVYTHINFPFKKI